MSMMLTPEKAFDMYRPLVEQNEQALPMVFYMNDKDEACVLALAMEMEPGTMQEVLAAVLASARQQLGPAKGIAFSCEGWVKSFDSEDEAMTDSAPGSYQREADAGASLAEVVTITGVTWDEGWTHIVPFLRGESGFVTWDEPNTCPALGGIADVLRDAVFC